MFSRISARAHVAGSAVRLRVALRSERQYVSSMQVLLALNWVARATSSVFPSSRASSPASMRMPIFFSKVGPPWVLSLRISQSFPLKAPTHRLASRAKLSSLSIAAASPSAVAFALRTPSARPVWPIGAGVRDLGSSHAPAQTSVPGDGLSAVHNCGWEPSGRTRGGCLPDRPARCRAAYAAARTARRVSPEAGPGRPDPAEEDTVVVGLVLGERAGVRSVHGPAYLGVQLFERQGTPAGEWGERPGLARADHLFRDHLAPRSPDVHWDHGAAAALGHLMRLLSRCRPIVAHATGTSAPFFASTKSSIACLE